MMVLMCCTSGVVGADPEVDASIAKAVILSSRAFVVANAADEVGCCRWIKNGADSLIAKFGISRC